MPGVVLCPQFLENLVDTFVEIEGSGACGRPRAVHVLIYFLCGVPKLKW